MKQQKQRFIVVLQRSWVVVGLLEDDGFECVLTEGAVVERWGTAEGLGQLAIEGPLEETRLRKLPESRWHRLSEVFRIRCNDDVWKEERDK